MTLASVCQRLVGSHPLRTCAWAAQQLRLPLQHSQQQSMSTASISDVAERPVESTVSEELLSRLKDKSLLHTAGFVGGRWVGATDRSTYQVTPAEPWDL
jgi:hypothetical protein